jgi:ubiquitin C-terminal hydrolase
MFEHALSIVHIQFKNTIGNFLPLSLCEPSDKPLYTPLLIRSYDYTTRSKLLATMLDEPIEFNKGSVTLTVEVASSVVNKIEQLENEQRNERDRLATKVTDRHNLNPVKSKQKTLLDCFKLFTKKEILSDDDLWFCPKCKAHMKASKKIDLWRLPPILIVQLKRFNYTRFYRDKIDLLIDCPLRSLDLSQFVENIDEKANTKYDLIAVSNHMGGLGGGHYTAHAINSYDRSWHTFDDGWVSNIDENRVISSSAYVLIYQRSTK